MRTQRRHTHAGGAHLHVGVHDFARLVVHLHLLFGVAVVGKHIDMRNQIVSELIGKFFDRNRLTVKYFAILLFEFGHGRCAGAAGRLIGGHMHTFDVRQVFDGFQRHHHLNGCAVRIGYDTSRTHFGIFGIHLGHHQRHTIVHAERARIVNHNGAEFGNVGPKLLRHRRAGRHKRDGHAFEIVAMTQFAHHIVVAAECVGAPCTTRRSKQQ